MPAETAISDVGLSFDRFVDSVREDDNPVISPAKFARAFHIPLQEVAAEARVHRNTLRRHLDSPQGQRVFRDTLKVLSAVSGSQGDVGKGMYWMRNHPIPVFGHKTAWELTGKGRADDVVAYIDSISDGFSGVKPTGTSLDQKLRRGLVRIPDNVTALPTAFTLAVIIYAAESMSVDGVLERRSYRA